MTASSGPGISLMQEGISYMAGAELPCVIADITRGGPGLGNIAAEQSDYHQVVKGRRSRQLPDPGAGATFRAGDGGPDGAGLRAGGSLSQPGGSAGRRIYRTDDGAGRVSAAATEPKLPKWAVAGTAESRGNLITSLHLEPDELEAHVRQLEAKYYCGAAGSARRRMADRGR
jgi:2-oxoisovalerate ferredoxin oxidoreductase alpha subunit